MNRFGHYGAALALLICLQPAHAELALGSGSLCGNGLPDPGEQCDDGNMTDGDGCSSTCQIESGLYFCTAAQPGETEINLLRDGSFENANADGDWAEISHSLFGSLLCDDGCFKAPLASDIDGNIISGNFVLVSGGTFNEVTTGVVEHTPVVIPDTATTMSFNIGLGVAGVDCPEPDDGLRLFIDGQQVWSSPAQGEDCRAVDLYEVVDVDISNYADNQPHVIRFEGRSSTVPDFDTVLNIFLDQVRILVPAPDPQPPTPSQCFLVACGDGIQTPSEQCDDGNVNDGDGCSSVCAIEQPNFVCTDGELPAPNANLIANGDLEAGDEGSWAFDGAGASPLCSQALCAQDNPFGAAFYAWFRGSTGAAAQTMSQLITVPVTATTLAFDLAPEACATASDTLEVLVDGTVVFSQSCATAPLGDKAVIDMSAFADGEEYLLTLRYSASGESGFFVDNLRLSANTPFSGAPSACSELAAACNTPETFDTGLPADWTIVNVGTNPAAGWGTSDDGVCGSNGWLGGNVTGGGGASACADSDAAAQALDTYLCSPALDVMNVTQPVLSFLANYQARSNADGAADALDVLIGTEAPSAATVPGYSPVTTIIDHLDGDNLGLSSASLVQIDLATFASSAEVYACLRYRGNQDWFAQVDNVALRGSACVAPSDQDLDTVDDSVDNCTLAPNPSQLDTDGDGYGNACDADFNDDCIVNFEDLGLFRKLFFGMNNEADLNGDGVTGFVDLGLLRVFFFTVPGPSAAGSCSNQASN